MTAFADRPTVLREIAAWHAEVSCRVLVLAGPAGSGTSTVLRTVAAKPSAVVGAGPTLPRDAGPLVTVDCRGLAAHAVRRQLLAGLPDECRALVLLDDLYDGTGEAATLLRDLVDRGARVIVTCGGDTAALTALLDGWQLIEFDRVDLRAETRQAVHTYCAHRLARMQRPAAVVARAVAGDFLAARLSCDALLAGQDTSTVAAAAGDDDPVGALVRLRMAALLREAPGCARLVGVLAHGQGRLVDHRLWPHLAVARYGGGHRYDAAEAVTRCGRWLVTSGASSGLFHARLEDAVRDVDP